MRQKAFDQPSQVDAEAGEVVLRGPDGGAFSLTPAAARESAARLLKAAEEAEAQPTRDPDEQTSTDES